MNDIQNYLGTNQNFDVGVEFYLKHKSEYADFFKKNKGAKKGSVAHNILIQELKRLVYELKITEKAEEVKKKSLEQVIQEVQKPNPVIKVPEQKLEVIQETPSKETKKFQKISKPKSKKRIV